MPLKLTAADWRALFPRAPQSVIDAFASPLGEAVLNKAGITHTKTRLAYALANVEHECGGFTIPKLTENIGYTAKRMAQVWPNRFSSAAAVQARYGVAPGWQLKAFDDIYGNRMGNRPGTSDGSRYIGRGGPQITGRDGYRNVGERCGLNLVDNPEMACLPVHQPAILAGFWEWKGMNRYADSGNWAGAVKAWNGGTNGMADRAAQMKGNRPILDRLETFASVAPALDRVPGPPVDRPTVTKAPQTKTVTQIGVATGGAAAAVQVHKSHGWPGVLVVVAVALVIGFVVWKFWPTAKA